MNCDILFSYSSRRDYVGTLFNYRNTTSLQVQRVFDATRAIGGPAQNVPPLYTGVYTGVIVNGVNFGTGRIVSFSNPTSPDLTENGSNLWKQIVNVEIYESGNISNIGSSNAMVGLAGAYNAYLAELQETYAFDLSANGDYQYGHTVSVKCTDEATGAGRSGYIMARIIASGLIASQPNFGYIDAVHSGYFTSIGGRSYSETTDAINGTITFEEKFIIQNRDFVKHSVGFDNGYITINEQATLRHSGVSTASGVFTSNPGRIMERYSGVIAQSYSRCNSLWTTYKNVMGNDAYTNSLWTQPSQITKSFDEKNQEFTYSVIYTNNPQMANGYLIDREQQFSEGTNGITEATEQATITAFDPKSTTVSGSLASYITSEMALASGRLTEIWAANGSAKLVSESKTLSARGKKAGYSMTFTNDPSFVHNNVYLTRTISVQDTTPIRMHQPYIVLGRKTPLVHNPGQTQMGNVSSTIAITWPRNSDFSAAAPDKPMASLNQMFIDTMNAVLTYVSNKTPLDVFVTKVSYSYGSDLHAEMTTEAQYVYARTDNI